MSDITLSIIVPVYNHEKFIVQALDSILMQKTQYSYEVWIGEDASTDNTRAVLMEYEKKCPDNFHFLYREMNMNNLDHKNSYDLRLRCTGKYLICLEGDDFWTDELKIQKQIDFLENHPEYYAVSHNCIVVDENSNPNGEEYPECKDCNYSFAHYSSEIMPGQTATVMMRNYLLDKTFNSSILSKPLTPGDRLIYFSLLCHGAIYCMQVIMSAYRHITTSGSSFSATNKYIFKTTEEWHSDLLDYAFEINNKTGIKIAKLLYFRCIGLGVKKRAINIFDFFSFFKKINFSLPTAYLYIKGKINKCVFHRQIWYKKI